MLVSAEEMLTKAKAGKYAVGQFNINNLEWTKSILLTAQELKSPVILGVSEGAGKYMCGYKTVVGMVNGMLEELKITVPVALHLDHGSYEGAKACIEAGFSSIMFDGSHYPIEENVAKTKELVAICKEKGIQVILAVGGGSTIDASKHIAAAACYAGEPWDLVKDRSLVKNALPIAVVLTICATGSEMNSEPVLFIDIYIAKHPQNQFSADVFKIIISTLFNYFQKIFMHRQIIAQFRVKSCYQLIILSCGHYMSVHLSKHIGLISYRLNIGRTDKCHRYPSNALKLFIRMEASELSAVGIAFYGYIH